MKATLLLLTVLVIGCDRDTDPAPAPAARTAPKAETIAAPTTQPNSTRIWELKTKVAFLKAYLDRQIDDGCR